MRRFSAAQGDPLDAMETNAPGTLAAIAADPRLHGDPVAINRAQSQYLTNVNQARAVNTLATHAATERLIGAAIQSNITDLAQLQKAYPGALADWTSLSASSQRTLTNQLTAAGNQPTIERDTNFQEWRGKLVNPATSAAASTAKLQDVDLTRAQYTTLWKMQQDVRAKGDKMKATQVSINRALQNPLVKSGTAKLDQKEFDVFTGALSGEMESWLETHPGKKPTDMEIANLANGLLAKRTAYSVSGGTFERPSYEVPEFWLKQAPPGQTKSRKQILTEAYGREPTPAEVAYVYQKSVQ